MHMHTCRTVPLHGCVFQPSSMDKEGNLLFKSSVKESTYEFTDRVSSLSPPNCSAALKSCSSQISLLHVCLLHAFSRGFPDCSNKIPPNRARVRDELRDTMFRPVEAKLSVAVVHLEGSGPAESDSNPDWFLHGLQSPVLVHCADRASFRTIALGTNRRGPGADNKLWELSRSVFLPQGSRPPDEMRAARGEDHKSEEEPGKCAPRGQYCTHCPESWSEKTTA